MFARTTVVVFVALGVTWLASLVLVNLSYPTVTICTVFVASTLYGVWKIRRRA